MTYINSAMAAELEELALAARIVANKLSKLPKPAPRHAVELMGAVTMLRNWARELRKPSIVKHHEKA